MRQSQPDEMICCSIIFWMREVFWKVEIVAHCSTLKEKGDQMTLIPLVLWRGWQDLNPRPLGS